MSCLTRLLLIVVGSLHRIQPLGEKCDVVTIKSMSRLFCLICLATLSLGAQAGVAQTPEVAPGSTEGRGVDVEPRQRDLVLASNADAFLFGEQYPRVDVMVKSVDLSCFQRDESREYTARQGVTLEWRWCLNAQNGLVTAASRASTYGSNLEVQGAFCSWDTVMGQRAIDEILCMTVIQEVQCGGFGNPCVHEVVSLVLRGDGSWVSIPEPVGARRYQAYGYDASLPYPLSGD